MSVKNFISPRHPCCEFSTESVGSFVPDSFAEMLIADLDFAMANFVAGGHLVAVPATAFNCAHEISHAAAAMALGVPVEKVTTTHAHYSPDRDGLSAADAAFTLLAGRIGSGFFVNEIVRFTDSEWKVYVGRARAGASRCDSCKACARVLSEIPSATNSEIIAMLRTAENQTIEFFVQARRDGELWERICCAAERLLEAGELSGDELREILKIETASAPPKGERSPPGQAASLPSARRLYWGQGWQRPALIFEGER